MHREAEGSDTKIQEFVEVWILELAAKKLRYVQAASPSVHGADPAGNQE